MMFDEYKKFSKATFFMLIVKGRCKMTKEQIINELDNIVEEVLSELGLTVETAHLYSADKKLFINGKELSHQYYNGQYTTEPASIFNDLLTDVLIKKKVDLSFDSATTKKGIHVGGNHCGIAGDITYYLWQEAWSEVKFTKQELEEYLGNNPDIKIYRSQNYSYIQTTKEELLNTTFGSNSRDMGYGSQSSVINTTVKLKKDKFGNLLIDRFVEIWD